MSGLAPPITDWIEVRDGERLFFGEWPGPAPAFIFAHGLTSTHRNIGAVAQALDGKLQVIAPDLLGRGNSTNPPSGSYGMAEHARDVLGLMDALGIEQAVVGGHSMGAYVANAVVTEAPDRVLGLILIDGGVFAAVPVSEAEADALFEPVLGPVVARMNRRFETPDEYRSLWQEMPYFGEDWGPIMESYLFYDLGRRGEAYGSKCSEIAAVEDWRDLLSNPQTPARLGQVKCPVLAIGAEFGLTEEAPAVLLDGLHVEILRNTLEDVEFVRVNGTTHHTVTLSDHGAAATADAIAKFVGRLGS